MLLSNLLNMDRLIQNQVSGPLVHCAFETELARAYHVHALTSVIAVPSSYME
jgi:hypothetical protein